MDNRPGRGVVVVIPSRYGSTRFPGKPLAHIAGKPMIRHVYERAAAASSVRKVVVATDDERIAAAVEAFGGHTVPTATSARSGTDRVAEAARRLALGPDEIVVNVQGDQPLMDPRCIDELVAPFAEGFSREGMTTLAFAIVDPRELTDPKDVKVTFASDGRALYFSRSLIPYAEFGGVTVYKHLGFYAYTRRFLEVFEGLPTGRLERIERLEQLRALEHLLNVQVVVTGFDSPEVDLPVDIERVERRLGKGVP
jgi:3-deoxy-manno-octulosonate cytidylyltransferase (CMP-KDO synthetase)